MFLSAPAPHPLCPNLIPPPPLPRPAPAPGMASILMSAVGLGVHFTTAAAAAPLPQPPPPPPPPHQHLPPQQFALPPPLAPPVQFPPSGRPSKPPGSVSGGSIKRAKRQHRRGASRISKSSSPASSSSSSSFPTFERVVGAPRRRKASQSSRAGFQRPCFVSASSQRAEEVIRRYMEVVPGVPDEVTCTLPNFFFLSL